MEVCSNHFKRPRPKRGGTLIRSATLPTRTEEVLALIGFGLGRRLDSPDYAGQTDFAAGGPTEPIESRSNFPVVHSGRQEFDPSAVASDLEDLAWPTRTRHGRSTSSPVDVPVGVRRACEQGCTASTRVKRPRTDLGPPFQTDLDIHECLELSSMGSSGKDLEAFEPRPDLLHGSLQDDRAHSPDCEPAGVDPSVHGLETDGLGSVGSSFQCSDPLEIRHFPPERGQPGALRPSDKAHGQWPDTADSGQASTLDFAEVALGTGGGPDPQKMRTLLLQLSLGNDANDCFMNTALLGELWACCMDNTFSWELLGTWQQPVLQLLDRGPNTQWLTDSSCLGLLLDGWYASHAMGLSTMWLNFWAGFGSPCIAIFLRILSRHLVGRHGSKSLPRTGV